MKKHKNTWTAAILVLLILFILAAVLLLGHKKEDAFVPEASESISSSEWTEAEKDKTPTLQVPTAQTEESESVEMRQGDQSDDTQNIIAEDETETTSSLSITKTKEDAQKEKPSEPSVTDADLTDPDTVPTYPDEVPTSASQTADTKQSGNTQTPDSSAAEQGAAKVPASGTNTGQEAHPGQVYDPAFGWITPSQSMPESIDSDGDVNKQIGTMGGN